MKTAISVPDNVFERASQRAKTLGLSRSEFFTRAAQRYLDDLDTQLLTSRIDSALDELETPDESAADAVVEGHRVLGAVADQW